MKTILMGSARFALCLLCVTSSIWAHGGLTPDALKKLFPEAENFVSRQKVLSAQAITKVEQSSGSKIHDVDKNLTVYVALGKDPQTKKTRSIGAVLMVDAKGARGMIDLAVAYGLDGTVKRVLVMKNADDKTLESETFLKQFEGKKPSDRWDLQKDFNLAGNPASAREVIQAVRRGMYLFLAFMNP
ncbi:MAG: hypothetical protein HYX74_07055 [Acidobacteria bacterium]|nr:hypothetical protein [Acidobacteriota bacterium]